MMLLDTCVIIWDAIECNKLTDKARNAINQADDHNALIIADISMWEICMLVKKGRLEIDTTPANFINLFLESRNVAVQPITPEIAELSNNLNSDINSDPADRLIAATSIIINAQLVTSDQNLRDSQLLKTIW